jgi:hypothetical protein
MVEAVESDGCVVAADRAAGELRITAAAARAAVKTMLIFEVRRMMISN